MKPSDNSELFFYLEFYIKDFSTAFTQINKEEIQIPPFYVFSPKRA